jgi:hypothetical protein
MHIRHIEQLLTHICSLFDSSDSLGDMQIDALPADDRIVTTRWIAESQAAPLPWRHPLLVWVYDLFRGHPRTTLYRPITYFCGAFWKCE